MTNRVHTIVDNAPLKSHIGSNDKDKDEYTADNNDTNRPLIVGVVWQYCRYSLSGK